MTTEVLTSIWGRRLGLAHDDGLVLSGSRVSRANHRVIRSADDLPTVSGGVHQLEDNTLYEINGLVTTANPVQFGDNSFIAGHHWAADILVYTGAGAALQADGHEFFAKYLTVVAPNGQGLNLTANSETEFLMTLCAFVNCSELGVIDGYRVPTIVKCAFETFGAGLTFTGTSEKVLVDGSPFRGAAASASCIEFDADFATGDIDLAGNYFKTLGAGAVGVRWVSGAAVSGFGLVRGNIIETGGTFSTGIGPETIGWQFVGNSGVRDSDRSADLSMSDNATATTLTVNVWAKIAGTTVANLAERLEMTASNRIENVSPRMIRAKVTYAVSVLGSQNGQEIETAMFTNTGSGGAMEIASAPIKSVLTGPAGARADNLGGAAIIELGPDEYVELWVRCTSGSDSVTAESLQLVAIG